MIGYFGWLTTPAPGLVYVLYTALLGGLLALRIAARGRRLSPLASSRWLSRPSRSTRVDTYEVSAFAWQGGIRCPSRSAFRCSWVLMKTPVSGRRSPPSAF